MNRNRSVAKKNTAVAEGSIMDMAQRRGERVEAIMADADIVVMLDISSSMACKLRGGAWAEDGSYEGTRFSEAIKALRAIQARYQGRVLVVAFNNTAEFVIEGLPQAPSGGTNLLEALRVVKDFDDTDMKIALISDGEPGSLEACYAEAATFKTPIDTIFIGNDNDQSGLEVMNRIAAVSRGKALGKVDVHNLGETSIKLLGGR